MGKDDTAKDWEFAGILSAGASCGFAAGGWIFSFRSTSLNYREDFILLGVGVGTPGVSVEVSLPSFMEVELSWSKVTSKRKQGFSAADLHLSPGSIGVAGVAVLGVGYSRLYAEAGYWVTPETRSGRVDGGLFSNTLNDGLGVAGESGVKDAQGLVQKGLQVKKLTVGAMAVLGVWFGIGDVVSKSAAAAGKLLITTLSAGLFQAGEALLTGRGMAVWREFAEGYAQMLAECTALKPNITQTDFQYYKSMNWQAKLATYGQKYVDEGSRANYVLSECYEAGMAAILQETVAFVNRRGENAWYDVMRQHRQLYGKELEFRRNAYLDQMYRQVDRGEPVGFRLI